MNKTQAKTHEKRQERENKIFKNFAKSNNHCMPEWTSSTRNDYERKISYDWSNLLIVNCNKYNPLINA